VELSSEAAVPVGMAIHELTTNAAKHGALSVPGGGLGVRWRIDSSPDGPRLHFEWEEHGGPPVRQPVGKGFGSRLLERVLTTQLQAQVRIGFDPAGLRFVMTMPLPEAPALLNPLS
jgi:two-component sensor histidine kinase